MTETYFTLIIERVKPELGEPDAQEGELMVDGVVSHLCEPDNAKKELTKDQYVNLISLLEKVWWCSDTAIGRLMKESKHPDFIRKNFRDDIPLRDRWEGHINKLVTSMDRRLAMFPHHEGDPKRPDNKAAKETLEEAK